MHSKHYPNQWIYPKIQTDASHYKRIQRVRRHLFYIIIWMFVWINSHRTKSRRSWNYSLSQLRRIDMYRNCWRHREKKCSHRKFALFYFKTKTPSNRTHFKYVYETEFLNWTILFSMKWQIKNVMIRLTFNTHKKRRPM